MTYDIILREGTFYVIDEFGQELYSCDSFEEAFAARDMLEGV
jgi:hypothetical protein